MIELWKAIDETKGRFEVSNIGRIRSIRITRSRTVVRMLKPYQGNPYGHLKVTMSVGNKKIRRWVHRLVALAFLGPAPVGKRCLHNDGCCQNNHIGNLRWGTQRENAEDARKHGSLALGNKLPHAKLTPSIVLEIRQRITNGEYQWVIAEDLGVSQGIISNVKHGRTWRHVAPCV